MAKRDGFHTITPYLIFDNPVEAFEYYQQILGATILSRSDHSDGSLRHAELRIGDSPVMISGGTDRYAFLRSAKALGGSPIHLFIYCDDADDWFRRLTGSGGSVVMAMADQDYGRSGGVTDPFGITWWVTTHKD